MASLGEAVLGPVNWAWGHLACPAAPSPRMALVSPFPCQDLKKGNSCFSSLWGCDKGRLGQWSLGKCFLSQSGL